MFEAVIFDMDGVIIDSEPLHIKSDLMLLSDFGIAVENDVLNQYVGTADAEMWADLRERFSLDISVDEIMVKSIENKKQIFSSVELEAVKGVRELLHEIKSKKLSIGLASSSPADIIELILQRIEIREYFETIVSGQEVPKGKPEPDIFLKAAKLLGKRPENCIVIEDSEHGVKAAKRAGMKCIGFISPGSGRQDLSEADNIASSMESVKDIILEEYFGK